MEAAVVEWRKRPHFELVETDDAKPWAVAAATRQKKRNYDDVVVTGSSLAGMTTSSTDMPMLETKEEERAKRLKAIDSRIKN